MRNMFSKLALVVALGLALAFTLSCSGGDDDGSDTSSPSGGDVSSSSGDNVSDGLICSNGEAWLKGSSCGSAKDGLIFKSNGDLLDIHRKDNVWILEDTYSWQTNGNTLIMVGGGMDGQSYQYEVSNGALTMIRDEDGKQSTYNKKCGGMTVGWQ